MKTKVLKDIFEKNTIKKFWYFFVICSFSVLGFEIVGKINSLEELNLTGTIGGVLFAICVFGPVVYFYTDQLFPRHLEFLKNRGFNRKDLLKFYFFSQTKRVFLVSTLYLWETLIALVLSKKELAKKSEFNFEIISHDFYSGWLIILFVVAFAYFIPTLASFGKSDKKYLFLQRSKPRRKEGFIFFICCIIFASGVLYFLINVSEVFSAISIIIVVFSVIANNLICTFDLMSERKAWKAGVTVSLVTLLIPYLLLTYFMYGDLKDPNFPAEKKRDLVEFFEHSVEYSNEQAYKIISSKGKVHSVIEYLGESLSIPQMTSVMKDNRDIKDVSEYLVENRILNEIEYEQFLNGLESARLSIDDFNLNSGIKKIFRRQILADEKLDNYIKNESLIFKTAATFSAHRHMSKQEFAEWYNEKQKLMSSSLRKSFRPKIEDSEKSAK